MYYNSNKNNNDYYNSYKKEIAQLDAYRKEENTQKIIKIILFLLSFVLLLVAAFYLYKYFNPIIDSKVSLLKQEKQFPPNNQLASIVIREESLAESIQLRESRIFMTNNIHKNATDTTQELPVKENQNLVSSMNEKDIALIVQIIMSQMNKKVEKPLEEQLKEVNEKIYENKSLEKTNHYNKIILTKNEIIEVKNASLMELTHNLNNIINETITSNSNYNYTTAIEREVLFRTNEMRVIIVQRGDTLSRIAKKAYGDYDDYQKIFTANPEIIKNPNQIFIGQRLRIPS
jgi:hypothetical protein